MKCRYLLIQLLTCLSGRSRVVEDRICDSTASRSTLSLILTTASFKRTSVTSNQLLVFRHAPSSFLAELAPLIMILTNYIIDLYLLIFQPRGVFFLRRAWPDYPPLKDVSLKWCYSQQLQGSPPSSSSHRLPGCTGRVWILWTHDSRQEAQVPAIGVHQLQGSVPCLLSQREEATDSIRRSTVQVLLCLLQFHGSRDMQPTLPSLV